MSQEQLIFPILKQSADASAYAKQLLYFKYFLGAVVVVFGIQLIYFAVRRYYIPRHRIQQDEHGFFTALAHAFNLDNEELELVWNQVVKQRLPEPSMIFCSERVFDPCFKKEIEQIQKKRMLSDEKKGHEMDRIYRIRHKIYA